MYGIQFENVNLSNTILVNVTLNDAVFIGNVDFSNSNMTDAKLGGARRSLLNRARGSILNFRGANLTRTNMIRVNLYDFDLTDADLTDTIFFDADLTDNVLNNPSLYRANLNGVRLDDRNNLINRNLSGLILTHSTFTRANLTGVNLTGANLTQVRFSQNINLTNANFTNAILTNANFNNSILTNANFTNANLTNVIFKDSILTSANFTNTNLTSTHFQRNTNLSSVILSGTYITLSETDIRMIRRLNIELPLIDRINITSDMINYLEQNPPDFFGINHRRLTEAYIALHPRVIPPPPPRVMPPPLPPRNVENLRRNFENNNANPEGPRGVAYEVHNSYDKFLRIKDEYLSIIDQPDNTEYATKDTLYVFIYDNFEPTIKRLFPEQPNKLEDFDMVFEKLVGGNLRLSKDEMSLIGKSVSFAFSQDDNFKEQYIISFLDETCNAYTGSRDNTSCVKGIKERLVLSVGYVVEIVCKTGCDNETYIKLDNLLNPKFDVAQEASEWFQNKSNNEKLQEAIKQSTKKIMITYIVSDLIDKAKQMGSYNSAIDSEIRRYINELISSSTFDDFMDGGRKTRRSRKSRKSRKPKKMGSKKSKKRYNKKSTKKNKYF